MSERKKLFQTILNKPEDLRFEDLEKVIFLCGYRLDHTTDSHAIYIKKDVVTLTIPRKTPVKSYLLNQALIAISDCLEDML